MDCKLCGHCKVHKHGTLSNGAQRYRCSHCGQTFTERFDTLFYRRRVSPTRLRQVLQCYTESSSLPGIVRTTGLAYNTVISIIRAASQKAQHVHNAEVTNVKTGRVSADELWTFVKKSIIFCADIPASSFSERFFRDSLK